MQRLSLSWFYIKLRTAPPPPSVHTSWTYPPPPPPLQFSSTISNLQLNPPTFSSFHWLYQIYNWTHQPLPVFIDYIKLRTAPPPPPVFIDYIKFTTALPPPPPPACPWHRLNRCVYTVTGYSRDGLTDAFHACSIRHAMHTAAFRKKCHWNVPAPAVVVGEVV